LFSLIPEPNRY